jgi:hypothetical protein
MTSSSSILKQPLIKELSNTDRGSSFDSNYKPELADNYDFCMVLPVDEKTGELAVKGKEMLPVSDVKGGMVEIGVQLD